MEPPAPNMLLLPRRACHMLSNLLPWRALRSGKTTLVNYILQEKHGLRIGVIENEVCVVPAWA